MLQALQRTCGDVLMFPCCMESVLCYNSLRNWSKLNRSGVQRPGRSPWRYLFQHGDAQAFYAISGMTKSIFKRLYRVVFVNIPKKKRGRQPLLNRPGKLGLSLRSSQLHDSADMWQPSSDFLSFRAALVRNREPLADNVIGFIDGLSVVLDDTLMSSVIV